MYFRVAAWGSRSSPGLSAKEMASPRLLGHFPQGSARAVRSSQLGLLVTPGAVAFAQDRGSGSARTEGRGGEGLQSKLSQGGKTSLSIWLPRTPFLFCFLKKTHFLFCCTACGSRVWSTMKLNIKMTSFSPFSFLSEIFKSVTVFDTLAF